MSTLLKIRTPALTIQRNIGKCRYNWWNEGIQYFGFKYYPRNPETFKDPPYEPSKLFRVERIKPVKGTPYFERTILEDFRLTGKMSEYAIIKNIPENNQRLWKIKHLIRVVPITYPDGFPKEDDVTVLKENGELRIIKNVSNLNKRVELQDKFRTDVVRMDGDTLRRNSRNKWLQAWDTTP